MLSNELVADIVLINLNYKGFDHICLKNMQRLPNDV